ncbi:MAG: PASTA domain-containing protein [Acidobacteriia bacterium]|nr:PASTA domain-containing protein [Terriglobia bacterium]
MRRRIFTVFADQFREWICLGLVGLLLFLTPFLSPVVQGAAPQQKQAKSKDTSERLEVAPQMQKVTGLAAAQSTAVVPDLRGQTPKQAIATLRRAHLALGEVTYGIYDVPAGQVARQYPPARENAPAGSAVAVWVAREPPPGQLSTAVPDLRGQTLDEARKTLRQAHLVPGEIQYGNYDAPAGRVARQRPSARENAPAGSAVAVWITRESPPAPLTTPVPDLRGQTVDEAAAILRRARLVMGEVYFGNYDAAPGRVARQHPQPQERVPMETAVAVWVARAPDVAPPPPEQPPKRRPERQPGRQPDSELVAVPDLRSRQEVAAKMILEQRGLQYGGAKEIITDQQSPGTILDQQPKPDTLVRRGTAVRVAIAAGRPPDPTVEVPNLVQERKEEAQQKLRSVGLQSSDSEIREVDSEEETGVVVSQVPPAGTRVRLGTSVSFEVSRQIVHSLMLRPAPTSATPGEPVTFKAELIPPFPGATFQFNFGEGERSGELDVPEATHQYDDDGDYVVFSTATLGSRQVISNRVELPVHLARLDITLLSSPSHPRANETIQFHAVVTPSSQAGRAVYSFHFGDGTPVEASDSPEAQHSYPQSNQYSAWVTVRMVHEPLPGGGSVHEHFYTSDPIEVVIAPAPVPLWGIIGAILGAVLVAGAGTFSAYRWIQMQKLSFRVEKDAGRQWPQGPEHSIASSRWQFRVARSTGEQSTTSHGPLCTRIEKIHE